jgi:DNA-binding CsgD family transcriptional regulator
VAVLTSNRAELIIRHNESKAAFLVSDTPAIQLPVLFGCHMYGELRIVSLRNDLECPEVPLPVAHLLAETCGWIIHTLELSTLMRAQARHVHMHAPERLTDREQAVVRLMGEGFDEREIAQSLTISLATVEKHQQHIYQKLYAHSRHEALLVAYDSGLLSTILYK